MGVYCHFFFCKSKFCLENSPSKSIIFTLASAQHKLFYVVVVLYTQRCLIQCFFFIYCSFCTFCKCTFCKIFNFWSLLVRQCTSRSTNPQSRFVIISYFCFSCTFFAIHILPKIFSKMHLLHFAVYLILTGIRVCDSSEPTMHSGHPVIIELGIHPCVDSINYA